MTDAIHLPKTIYGSGVAAAGGKHAPVFGANISLNGESEIEATPEELHQVNLLVKASIGTGALENEAVVELLRNPAGSPKDLLEYNPETTESVHLDIFDKNSPLKEIRYKIPLLLGNVHAGNSIIAELATLVTRNDDVIHVFEQHENLSPSQLKDPENFALPSLFKGIQDYVAQENDKAEALALAQLQALEGTERELPLPTNRKNLRQILKDLIGKCS